MKTKPEKMMISSADGLQLAAVLFPASGAAADTVTEKTAAVGSPQEKVLKRGPLVIVCHGFTGSKEGGGRAFDMAVQLSGFGYSCLLFDFAGCGESEGRWAELTLTRQIADLKSMVDWGREAGFSPIIVNGRSFGGTTALCYAAADPEVGGVCTWAAAGRLRPLFTEFILPDYPASPGQVALDGVNDNEGGYINKEFFDDLDRYDVPACARRISPRPLLLLHGTADDVVPPADARLIKQTAGKNARLEIISGADHRFNNHTEQAREIFFRWIKENFPAGKERNKYG